MINRVLKFNRNTAGRDFIIGDLHGCISLLGDALRAAGFSPKCDRLFSVGDLVDRGRESGRVMELLQLPWFHAVSGNHEQMLLQAVELHGIDATSLSPIFIRNGLSWWLGVDLETRQRIVEAISQLPIVIEIETPRGNVGIVHASVPPGLTWQSFCARLEEGDEQILEHATWSRDRIRQGDDTRVPGIDRVFVGHSPGQDVRQLGNIYFIDTGAVFAVESQAQGASLTLANILCQTKMLAKSSGDAGNINLLDFPEPSRPFS